MSWTFEQRTGWLYWPSGERLSLGYSGHGDGVNNPDLEAVANVGPIPCGNYLFGEPENSPEHGPYALPLTPDPTNQMFGREGFMMHGDEKENPGQHLASEGCMIFGSFTRKAVWESIDHKLVVVATLPHSS